MDQLISITIILLILSLITEKITTFVKLHYPKLRIKRLTPEGEKEREKEITILSLVVGLLVALGLKANMFAMFAAENPGETLVWGSEPETHLIIKIIGSLLTGVVLSLGSKFWQDLLDLLLETRNLKRKLKEEKTYQVESSKELMEYLEQTEGEMVEKVLEENKDDLMSIENVVAVGAGIKEKDGKRMKCIVVHVTEKKKDEKDIEALKNKRQLIPQQLYYKLPGGQLKEIPVDVIQTGKAKTCIRVSPSDEISNSDPIKGALGTLGCCVTKLNSDKKLILTCYHVLKHHSHDWYFFEKNGNERILHPQNGQHIADMTEAVRDWELDIALAKPLEGTEISNSIPQIGTPRGSRHVIWTDVDFRTPVKKEGTTSGLSEGVIKDKNVEVSIEYPDESYWTLSNLIAVSTQDNKPLAKPGDSGSLLVDSNGVALGIIIASSLSNTYAIPIKTVLKRFNIKLC